MPLALYFFQEEKLAKSIFLWCWPGVHPLKEYRVCQLIGSVVALILIDDEMWSYS